MMKILLTFCLALFTLTTSAETGSYNWTLKDHQAHFADTYNDIVILLKEFPQVLSNSNYTAKDMDFVSVNEAWLEFTGETVCAPGDERLNYYSITFMACPKDDPTKCIVKPGEMIPNHDPCI
ncbi:MAG: hypothetical protein QF441_03415 [Bacteriovoracaceae bacterium]|jgi:hypothetical protein|nr:hypothetical protein [Halobacteriovoraceae bacterium]MDP7319626.1 hypothetical protein [Bacteriovoracaceae bacterium]